MSTTPPTAKPKRPAWIYALAALALLGICGIIASIGDSDADKTASAPSGAGSVANAPTATDAPTAVPTDAPIAPAFGDIEAKREGATDVQWDAFTATLAGNRVDGWPGIVREVKAAGKGYRVSVDLTPDGGVFGVSDTFIETADAAAATWGKDTPVVVSGTIKRVGSVLGSVTVTFEDGATIAAK